MSWSWRPTDFRLTADVRRVLAGTYKLHGRVLARGAVFSNGDTGRFAGFHNGTRVGKTGHATAEAARVAVERDYAPPGYLTPAVGPEGSEDDDLAP